MELADWLSPTVLEADFLERERERYAAAEPFPHANIQQVLRDDRLHELEDALATQEFVHKESDLFSFAQTDDLGGMEQPVLKEFVSFLNSEEFRYWIAQLTGVSTTPGRLDCFGAIYQDTDYLLCHDDRLADRKVAFIIYLTTLEDEEGGALALFTDNDGHPGTRVTAYPPVRNSMSLFTVSDKSWHEVEEVTEETYRVTVGGWLCG